jgi:ABC-type transport system involved in multi-copper enzyme maturation permease subunit
MTSLQWELRNLFRFPFPEVLLALFTYMVFLPRGGSFGFSLQEIVWGEITRKITFQMVSETARYTFFAFLPMAIFASIFATLAFAYEIENGLLKLYLSHPTSKRTIFLSKFLSCFLVVFLVFSSSLLAYTFLQTTENILYVILSPDLIFKLLLLAALETLFMTSIMVTFSLFSKKAALSLIGSFATIYLLQILSENVNLGFLPPISFRQQASFLFSPVATFDLEQLLNILITPIISVLLIIVSYLYFSRRLEVG